MKHIKPLFGTLITLALLVHVQAQDPFTNGLVAYYPFNGNANDESGNGNNGTVNSATLTVDRFGLTNSAYAFDGVSSFITVPDSPSLRISNDITVVCWVMFPQTNLGGTFLIKGSASPGYCGRNYDLRSWSDTTSTVWMLQQFPPWGGCIGCQENTGGVVPPAQIGRWYQLVGVRSGGVSRIYLDGIDLQDTWDHQSNNCAATTYIGPEPLTIGASVYPSPTPYAVMQGVLDDIRIYNRALSSLEVAQLYAIESPPILNLRKAVYLDSPNLRVGTNYQVQVSTDLNTWTNQGAAFTATNSSWRSTNYWDVDDWSSLFFRLQVSP